MAGTPSFDEFPAPTYEVWYQAALDALNGAPFDKLLTTQTYEGLVLQPLYRREDIAEISHQHTLPGFTPYVRGTDTTDKLWDIAQAIPFDRPADFNAALRHDLEHGQTAINLILDTPTRTGIDPDQSHYSEVGRGGLSIASRAAVAAALKGIDLEQHCILAQAGTAALPFATLLMAHLRQQKVDLKQISGFIASDPLCMLATQGTLPAPLSQIYDEMAVLTQWATGHTPDLDTIAVDITPYHDSGGHAVQELAFALATAADYIRAMQQRGLHIDDIGERMCFIFSVGSNFFMEIAKLRAARLLWSQVVAAFGGGETAQQMTLHAQTATRNKTSYDAYVNILRSTLQGLAGAVSGIDSLHISPFDVTIRPPDEFSRRIARNQQLILQHESNLAQPIDPAGGAYYVEYLTDWLAREAWSHFQEIEAEGGMFAALQAGIPQNQVTEVAARRADNLARRKDVLIGTNMYPDLNSAPLARGSAEGEKWYRERAAQIAAMRTSENSVLSTLSEAASDNLLEAAIEAAQSGTTLGQITKAIRPNSVQGPSVMPLHIHRIAEHFETLRQNAEAYAVRTGSPPQIFLANIGPLRQHKARADFATGFYEVGGFEILSNEGFATPDQAAQAALASGASVVVICSTDDTYPDIVKPFIRRVRADKPDTIIILAGYPQDQIGAHRAAGVDDFIHLRANCYDMNRKLQEQMGVTA